MSAQLADLRRLLDREARLLVHRLRGFTEARYAAAAPPFVARAAVARHLAQMLANTAQGIESAASHQEPSWRRLPDLPPLALADAVAVTANDLVAALGLAETLPVAADEPVAPPALPVAADEPVARVTPRSAHVSPPVAPPPAAAAQVWTPTGRRPALEMAAGALAELLLHRRDLDGSAPGSESAAAALEVLAPGAAAAPRLLLIQAQLRCPAYGPWRSG